MANVKHGVIRTDLMSGTNVYADMLSVRYVDAQGTPAEIDNGCVVALDGLMDGEREIWKAVDMQADSEMEKLAIIATPEVLYDERYQNLEDFVNPAGAAVRGYIPRSRNIFSVTAECLDIAEGVVPAAGYIVEVKAGHKLSCVAAATSAPKFGEIIAVEQSGRYTFYVIQVA